MPPQQDKGLGPSPGREMEYYMNSLKPKVKVRPDGTLEIPPAPASLDPDPLVVGGGKNAARAVGTLLSHHPDIKRKVNQFNFVPAHDTDYIMRALSDPNGEKLKAEDFYRSNLYGHYNEPKKSITINPRLLLPGNIGTLGETLMHEATHAAGGNHWATEYDNQLMSEEDAAGVQYRDKFVDKYTGGALGNKKSGLGPSWGDKKKKPNYASKK